MGLCVFSLPISLVIERIYILYLIIIIKSEVWTITHCLGLGHETMVCAVCLSVFLWHVQNCDKIGSFESKLQQKEFSHYFNHFMTHILHTFPEISIPISSNTCVTMASCSSSSPDSQSTSSNVSFTAKYESIHVVTQFILTHCVRVTPCDSRDLGQHWLR